MRSNSPSNPNQRSTQRVGDHGAVAHGSNIPGQGFSFNSTLPNTLSPTQITSGLCGAQSQAQKKPTFVNLGTHKVDWTTQPVSIYTCDRYTRDLPNQYQNCLFLFGDDETSSKFTIASGSGNQAVIRGLNNAAPIITKNTRNSCFDDTSFEQNAKLIDSSIDSIKQKFNGSGFTKIVIPQYGFGTGGAKLKDAPKTLQYLNSKLSENFGYDNSKNFPTLFTEPTSQPNVQDPPSIFQRDEQYFASISAFHDHFKPIKPSYPGSQGSTVTKPHAQSMYQQAQQHEPQSLTRQIALPIPQSTTPLPPDSIAYQYNFRGLPIVVLRDNIKWRYSHELLEKHPDYLYVFGDNVSRVATGGQACIRYIKGKQEIPENENPKVVGITTCNNGGTFTFNDKGFDAQKAVIERDIQIVINRALTERKTLVLPEGGFGTGLGSLPEVSPKTWEYLCDALRKNFGFNNKNPRARYDATYANDPVHKDTRFNASHRIKDEEFDRLLKSKPPAFQPSHYGTTDLNAPPYRTQQTFNPFNPATLHRSPATPMYASGWQYPAAGSQPPATVINPPFTDKQITQMCQQLNQNIAAINLPAKRGSDRDMHESYIRMHNFFNEPDSQYKVNNNIMSYYEFSNNVKVTELREHVHDYVQSTLPTRGISQYLGGLPHFRFDSGQTIKFARNDITVKNPILKECVALMHHFGLKLNINNGLPSVGPDRTYGISYVGDGHLLTRSMWSDPGNHNTKRLTRLMLCLVALGEYKLASEISELAVQLGQSCGQNVITLLHWRDSWIKELEILCRETADINGGRFKDDQHPQINTRK